MKDRIHSLALQTFFAVVGVVAASVALADEPEFSAVFTSDNEGYKSISPPTKQ
jgi:hypothetical protein